jgi:hypothetical protein
LLLAEETGHDEDGNPFSYSTDAEWSAALRDQLKEKINETTEAIASRTVLPQAATLIENFVLQATNQWGEKRGEPVTFAEYLVSRAEAYMSEVVDSDGRTKSESTSSYYRGTTTRIAYVIDKHLHYAIEAAMKKALADANSAIVNGIEAAVKMKLAEIQKGISASVKVS